MDESESVNTCENNNLNNEEKKGELGYKIRPYYRIHAHRNPLSDVPDLDVYAYFVFKDNFYIYLYSL